MSKTSLKMSSICKSFYQGSENIEVLKEASLEIKVGEIVGLVGQSGSGKTTLLQIAGLLDNADSGEIIINGQDCSKLNDSQATELRNKELGFVYQFHHLLPEFTALENVLIPQKIGGNTSEDAALKLLSKLGLDNRVNHLPSELSGGEQQRVAIARALSNKPSLLLADEPTGNLDPQTAKIVLDEILSLVKDQKMSALIVTHNIELAKKMNRILTIKDGRLEEL